MLSALQAFVRFVALEAARRARPKVRVAIDAGHGGRDPGAHGEGPNGRHLEKNVALGYALATGQAAADRGHAAMLTRDEDEDLAPDYPNWRSATGNPSGMSGKAKDLARRCERTNEWGAEAFVSLHLNSASSRAANGVWCVYAKGSLEGRRLAGLIFERLRAIPGLEDSDRDVEVYPDGSPWVGNRSLYVLRNTRPPAVLVELGFLTNRLDATQLTAVETRALVANAILDGLEDWKAGKPDPLV